MEVGTRRMKCNLRGQEVQVSAGMKTAVRYEDACDTLVHLTCERLAQHKSCKNGLCVRKSSLIKFVAALTL